MRIRATLATTVVAAATMTGAAVAPASAADGPSSLVTGLAQGNDVRCAVVPLLQNGAIASLVGEFAPASQCND